MESSGLVKRAAALVVISLLMPGGIPLVLAALVAGRIWRAGSPG